MTLTFDLLTLKVMSESRVTWATPVPILVFLGLSVLDLGPMYKTDRRQTKASLNAPPIRGGRGHNNTNIVLHWLYCLFVCCVLMCVMYIASLLSYLFVRCTISTLKAASDATAVARWVNEDGHRNRYLNFKTTSEGFKRAGKVGVLGTRQLMDRLLNFSMNLRQFNDII